MDLSTIFENYIQYKKAYLRVWLLSHKIVCISTLLCITRYLKQDHFCTTWV